MHLNLGSIALCALVSRVVALPVEETVATASVAAAKNKTLIDSTTYADIYHYAAFTEVGNSIMDGGCKHYPYGTVVMDYFSVNGTDTQAVLFRDDSRKEFILGIPGTDGIQDYLTDFTFAPVPYLAPNVECLGCLSHLGFLLAWDSIAGPVYAALNASLQRYPDYATVIAGHSLGGAIAQLAFGSMKPAFPSVKSVYTYGQPRVGNLLLADYINGLSGASDSNIGIYRRVTHYNDGVPQLPPEILGFVHPETELWESTMVPSQSTTYRCYGDEPADCNDSIGSGFINAAHTTYANLQYNCTS